MSHLKYCAIIQGVIFLAFILLSLDEVIILRFIWPVQAIAHLAWAQSQDHSNSRK